MFYSVSGFLRSILPRQRLTHAEIAKPSTITTTYLNAELGAASDEEDEKGGQDATPEGDKPTSRDKGPCGFTRPIIARLGRRRMAVEMPRPPKPK